MKIAFQVEDPSVVAMTLTVTMPLRDWRALRDELGPSGKYPAWKFSAAITDLIRLAEKHFVLRTAGDA